MPTFIALKNSKMGMIEMSGILGKNASYQQQETNK